MGSTITFGEDRDWSGGIYYDLLEFWRSQAPADPKLLAELSFGIESGTKYCDLSEISAETLSVLRKLVLRYQQKIQTPSQSRIRPEYLPRAIEEVNELIKMIDMRISELESKTDTS
jgi:hypothetical protein